MFFHILSWSILTPDYVYNLSWSVCLIGFDLQHWSDNLHNLSTAKVRLRDVFIMTRLETGISRHFYGGAISIWLILGKGIAALWTDFWSVLCVWKVDNQKKSSKELSWVLRNLRSRLTGLMPEASDEELGREDGDRDSSTIKVIISM